VEPSSKALYVEEDGEVKFYVGNNILGNPNRAKVVYGSTWTRFFASSSYLTIRLRESDA
jgi:hypothetical protein